MVSRRLALAAAGVTLVAGVSCWLIGGEVAPPRVQPPPARVVQSEPDRMSDAVREALLSGEAIEVARIEALPRGEGAGEFADGSVLALRRYENRRLTAGDHAKALALVRRLLDVSNRPFDDSVQEDVEQQVKIAQKLKDRALMAAVERTLTEGSAFLTEGIIPELKNDDRWHHWNVSLTRREGELRVVETLYVPIDLQRFPEVRARRARLADMREFGRAQAALAWNSRPFEERAMLVADAVAARREFEEVEAQLAAITDPARAAELNLRRGALKTRMSAVPREYDSVTLEVAGR